MQISCDSSSNTIRCAIKQRKEAITKLIERQRDHIKSQHLRNTSSADNYDVIVTFDTKGFQVIDSFCQLIADQLPQLQFEKQTMTSGHRQAIYVTANVTCLLETAHLMGIRPKNGLKLTSAQRQTIVRHYLDSLRYRSESTIHLPGVRLNDKQNIVSRLIKQGLIEQIFPLHSHDDLLELRRSWVQRFCSKQPLDMVCRYFGLKIAMYFAFLGHYTTGLMVPALIGLVVTLLEVKFAAIYPLVSDLIAVLMSFMNIIWATYYLKSLKVYLNSLAKSWDSDEDDSVSSELVAEFNLRPQYIADSDHVDLKRNLFHYTITLPVICLSLITVFYLTFYVLELQTYWDTVLIGVRHYPAWTSFVPKILLTVIITVMDVLYYRIAVWLNNCENHALETVHENHLVSKLVVFQFINSFLSLFYIAFYLGDMVKLYQQLATLLVGRQVIGNITEVLWPLLLQQLKLSPSLATRSDQNGTSNTDEGMDELTQVDLECSLELYSSTFDDHLEMFIQFGYVVIFGSIFPLGALCALINNFIEIRSDAFKLTACHQRPFIGSKVKDLGEWHAAYNGLVYVAIGVNASLMVRSGQLQRLFSFLEPIQIIMIGILVEHALIAIKVLIERKGHLMTLFGVNLFFNCSDSLVNDNELELSNEPKKSK